MATSSGGRPEGSHLGKTFHFKGDISGGEDIYIDGDVQGTIQLSGQVVTVGAHGTVNAEVQARDLVIHGKLKGNARAQDRIEVTRSGSVLGDLAMARISIQDGAFIQGRVDIHAVAHAAVAAAAPPPAGARPAVVAAPAAAAASPMQASLLERKP
ncbi:MAG: bactofilin family protein [Terriglobales bacterium]